MVVIQKAYQLGIRPLRGYNNKTRTLNISKSKISEFQKLKQEEISQAFVAQFVNETLVKIDRSYYKGDNKKQTKVKTSRIGF